MEGVRIFIHAVRMVLGNLNVAFRIAGVLLVIFLGMNLALGDAYLTGMPVSNTTGPMMQTSGLAFLFSVLQLIFGLWVAVAWHRFILLEETPGAYLPAWNGAANWAYLKAGFVLGLIVLLAVIPMMMIAGLLMAPMFMATSPSIFAGLMAFLIMYIPAAYIAYRLSPTLPAAAIGDRMGLKDAWVETSPSGSAFVVLTVVSVAAGWLIGTPTMLLASVSTTLAMLWSAIAQWVTVLVGASILTTIYGRYVQKRDLNA